MIPEKDAEFFDNLILNGAMEFAGVDEDGEMLYTFTHRLAEIDPELHKKFMSALHMEVYLLWNEGFLDLKDVGTEDTTIFLTDKAFDEESLSELDKNLLGTLENIKRALRP